MVYITGNKQQRLVIYPNILRVMNLPVGVIAQGVKEKDRNKASKSIYSSDS